ncbi:unnamed protein product [Ceutorhynchus assimilis]|uniref:Pyridoxal kinase n=1 Tax=Ceutorhynchus assimilis TaxID=467358 RepID=A0A9N9MXG0_9CUCU|nr:unnamed protein product [Ceutorhynchus assimilis]
MQLARNLITMIRNYLVETTAVMEPRILSIQSHVVSGYVGNKSAVFPMQLLGYDVDYINSVQFSNHTGYEHVKGQVISEQELAQLLTGLQKNKLDQYSHLLTGYVGSPGFLKELVNTHKYLKSINPNLIFVCDPVMGDNGQMYVPKELLPIYKESILPIATILFPNLFEAELLTDIKVESEANIWQIIEALHSKGIETVCISSAELPENINNTLMVFASNKKLKLKLEVPKLPVSFTGTGDLFSALMLCFLQQSDLKESLEKTMAAMQAVLKRTYDYACQHGKNVKNMELKLVQSREDILNPKIVHRATVVEI